MTLFGLPMGICLVELFILGTVVGSLLNVCIWRIPQHETLGRQLLGIVHPPSHCPWCRNRILWRDNVPILGWLLLCGRCRFCKGSISPRYPLIELANGLLWAGLYWLEVPGGFGSTIEDSCVYALLGPQGLPESTWLSPTAVVNFRYAYHLVLFEALIVATFIDFDLRIIPDASTVPAMIVGVLGGWAIGQVHLVPVWFQEPALERSLQDILPAGLAGWLDGPAVPVWTKMHPHLHGLAVSLAGLLVGGGMVWVVRIIGRVVLRQEAMGFGDVVLMALIGSFLGWQPTVVVFFLAPLCALAVVSVSWVFRRDREIPYGPYLSLGAVLVIVGWKHVWPIAERIFAMGPLVPVLAVAATGILFASLQGIQGVKWLLGIPLHPDEWIAEWTSADQLQFQAGENSDPTRGTWRRAEWPGIASGRGVIHERHWRRGE